MLFSWCSFQNGQLPTAIGRLVWSSAFRRLRPICRLKAELQTFSPTALSATDFFNVHLQNFAQPLGVGFGLGGFGERLMHPIQRLADRRRHGRVGQTVMHPALGFAGLNQTRVMEDGEVLGHGGRRKAEQLGDLADAQFPAPERQKNPHATGVGQRLGDGHEFAHIVISSNDEMNIARTMTARKRNF
jgi:hypothetical protein